MRARRGFSLLELLVVSGLMAGLAMTTAGLWRHFCAQSKNISDRSETAEELKIALESIAQDMGNVQWATPLTASRLLLCRQDANGQPGMMVEYRLDAGQLVRTETSTGLAFTIARDVTAFQVENVSETVLRLGISVERRGVVRQATLLWSRT